MASISSNPGYYSTSLALAVSLVVLLFAATAPCAQAQPRTRPSSTTAASIPPRSVKFVNHLAQTMNVTIGVAKLQTTTMAPGASAVLAMDSHAPLQIQVNGALYIDIASGHSGARAGALRSLVAEAGELSIVVLDGPCATGQAGLTLMGFADAKLVNPNGCAVRQ